MEKRRRERHINSTKNWNRQCRKMEDSRQGDKGTNSI